MRHVLIEAGVVTQVDLTGNPPDGYVEAPDDVHAGDHLIAGKFVSPDPEPPLVPEEISDRQFFQQLAVMALITEEEALDAVKTGTLPSAIEAFVDQLPAADQFSARMALCGATAFRRSNPLVTQFGGLQGMTSDQIDDLWRAAFQL